MTSHAGEPQVSPARIADTKNRSDVTAITPSVEEFTIITTGAKPSSRKVKAINEDEPLVDTTAALQLRSKKTERAQKRLQRKQAKAAQRPPVTNLLDLPPELLQEVLGHLRPSDIFPLRRVSQTLNSFILENERSIARDIVQQRYWVLSRSFFLPTALHDVDSSAHAALLHERRQEMLQLHRKPYEHVKGIDANKICTCINCVLAWNHLCLILDLAYWQKNMSERVPLPIIRRGTKPDWNIELLDAHASIVEKAMLSPLVHARILERHLKTIVNTILRTVRKKEAAHRPRLYHLTAADAATETDEFLERSGPPSHEFPWRRDNYHYLEAFVPNRIWSKDKESWIYYARFLHDRDLQWVVDRFSPSPSVSLANGSRMLAQEVPFGPSAPTGIGLETNTHAHGNK